MRSAKSQTLSGCRSATSSPEGRAKSCLSQRERCHKVTERVETHPSLISVSDTADIIFICLSGEAYERLVKIRNACGICIT